MQTKSIEALHWISHIMSDHNVPYQIVGGMAAKAYGATRELIDIDILVPPQYLDILTKASEEFLIYPPKHHLNDKWDMTYFALDYKGQRIEIGDGLRAKFYSDKTSEWVSHEMNYDQTNWIKFQDFSLAFIPKDHLVRYKKLLGREVDLLDIDQIKG